MITPDAALGSWTAGGPAVVAIPDATRPVDVGPALAALRDRVDGMRVIVGLGLHRPMDAGELAPLARWAPIQSDPDDTVVTGTVDGIPGAVARVVAEAELVISVGIAELHQYAGLSGGHKGVAVGCGGRATIAALHHRDRVTHPDVRLGSIQGNPFREAVDALGEAAGCRWALNLVPGVGWIWGEPRAVLREARSLLDPWDDVGTRHPGAVLRVPPAKAQSFYQASRALTYLALSPDPPLSAGATLVLDASCPEGLGAEVGFQRAMARSTDDLLHGAPPTGAGAQRAIMVALAARSYRLQVRGCARPEALLAVGIDASSRPAEVAPGWLDVPSPFTRLPQFRAGATPTTVTPPN